MAAAHHTEGFLILSLAYLTRDSRQRILCVSQKLKLGIILFP